MTWQGMSEAYLYMINQDLLVPLFTAAVSYQQHVTIRFICGIFTETVEVLTKDITS